MPQLQLKEYSKIHDKAFFSNRQFFNLFFWLQVSADMQNILQSMRSEVTMEKKTKEPVFLKVLLEKEALNWFLLYSGRKKQRYLI